MALSQLVPSRCLACAAWRSVDALGLCRSCCEKLAPIVGNRCRTCLTQTVGTGQRHCFNCQARPKSFHRLFALYDYQPPFDQVIRAYKFHRLAYLGEALADQGWDRFAESFCQVDALVPVPLPRRRLFARGYNQAEVIARRLAALLQRPMVRALVRIQGPPQSAMERESDRRRNVRRTLRLSKPRGDAASTRPLAGKRILVVDDLVTSGATAERAAQLLRRAGARRVWVFAAGHRP